VGAITEARAALAAAVASAGLDCTPYAPDTVAPPAAWVDTLTIDYQSGAGWSFCESGMATATILAAAQRNDRAGSVQQLEDLVPGVLEALQAIPGLRATEVASGSTDIGGQAMPAVIYTVQFAIAG
jgi:hypothetical protein